MFRLLLPFALVLVACGKEEEAPEPDSTAICFDVSMGCKYEACCEENPDGTVSACWYEMPDGTRYDCDADDCDAAAEEMLCTECDLCVEEED